MQIHTLIIENEDQANSYLGSLLDKPENKTESEVLVSSQAVKFATPELRQHFINKGQQMLVLKTA